MDIRDIIAIFRREKNLSEAKASEQAHAMLATIRGRHPRLEITAVVVDGLNTIICLANGTQVKFDPSLPVPIWKYPEGVWITDPKTANTRYLNVLSRLEYLEDTICSPKSTDDDKWKAQVEIEEILTKRSAKSITELRDRMLATAIEAEADHSMH